jgi:hypothetical protein
MRDRCFYPAVFFLLHGGCPRRHRLVVVVMVIPMALAGVWAMSVVTAVALIGREVFRAARAPVDPAEVRFAPDAFDYAQWEAAWAEFDPALREVAELDALWEMPSYNARQA